jgi:hypothetical protein
MAQYTKATDDNGTVRYKDGTKFVKGADVSDAVKEALAAAPEGTIIDELGEVVDPSTESDEGTEDEVLPVKQPVVEDTTSVDQEEVPAEPETPEETPEAPEAEPEAEPEAPAPVAKKKTKYEMGGMGFPALKGKTVSIFSDVPHETVKNIGGILVPMTMEEYKNKSDAEIMVRLKELGKI